MSRGFWKSSAYKKKLHTFRPDKSFGTIETYASKRKSRKRPCDGRSIEREVRQLLADKVCGSLVGLWLLIPEHLRLGSWDLLRGWSGVTSEDLHARIALQLVHESALCITGCRQTRTLGHKGFELANGLPFVGSDQAIHYLLDAHSVAEAQSLQVALGQLRSASGHFRGQLLALDPHRLRSYSQRHMPFHKPNHREENRPFKTAQTFFLLDADTHQPICLTTATAAVSVTQATPTLLALAEPILKPIETQSLLLADTEHFSVELLETVQNHPRFDLLVPMPHQPYFQASVQELPSAVFTRQWAGLSTAKIPYQPGHSQQQFHQIIQRLGEQPQDYSYKSFVCTTDCDELLALCAYYPKRWHIEEFFHAHQALGWKRAGTLNLNIRYGQMTLALIAQTVLFQLRQRLGLPIKQWDAQHFAQSLLGGLDGDIRVKDDTIIVTYYNAPWEQQLRKHYEGLPEKLQAEGIDPTIPWLYDFKLDFRFK